MCLCLLVLCALRRSRGGIQSVRFEYLTSLLAAMSLQMLVEVLSCGYGIQLLWFFSGQNLSLPPFPVPVWPWLVQ